MGKSSTKLHLDALQGRASPGTAVSPICCLTCLQAPLPACPGLLGLLQAHIFLNSIPDCTLGLSLSLPRGVEQNAQQNLSNLGCGNRCQGLSQVTPWCAAP